jgi:hypothetical protein
MDIFNKVQLNTITLETQKYFIKPNFKVLLCFTGYT